jgi:EAL domain-containing protein (putative c-di-GMP-specific phosphodiesterase class I)
VNDEVRTAAGPGAPRRSLLPWRAHAGPEAATFFEARLGVHIALDDFGSGYSNLGYLQRFPLHKLKIDKSFVAALGTSANGGVIIQAIVALGRALGLSVLVEGVETEQQRVLLRLAGCDELQGFLFAKPAPAKAIEGLLAHARGDSAPQPKALTA